MGRSEIFLLFCTFAAVVGCAAPPSSSDPADPSDPASADDTEGRPSAGDTSQPGASHTGENAVPAASPGSGEAPGAPSARCDRTKPFGEAKLAAGVNTTAFERSARLSADEHNLYFTRKTTTTDILHAQWSDTANAWVQTAAVPIDSKSNDGSPSISGDGLTMYFHSDRTAAGSYSIYVSRRGSMDASWSTPAKVAALTSTYSDMDPYVRPDGKMVVFRSLRSGASDLFVSYMDETRTLGAARAIAELNTGAPETDPVLSADGLAIYFARGSGARDIYVARRGKLDAKFGTPTPIAELDTSADERPTWISSDECVLYLSKADGSTSDKIYVAQRGR